jgi:hypothetical protein
MVYRHSCKDGTKLFFRGLRIWEAVVDELMAKGLDTAKQVYVGSIKYSIEFYKPLTQVI